ncbi:MAG: methylthioribulose 1-phosphate dehydratase [Cyanobacteria bacterium J06638_28]
MLHSEDPRAALSWVIHDIHQRGWAMGTGGNFSLVLEREPLRLLMAPSGVDKGLVTATELIEVGPTGQVLSGAGQASAETALHLAILRETGAASVLHTHSVFATLLSTMYVAQGELAIAGFEMLKGLESITSHRATVLIPILPNDQDMTQVGKAVTERLHQQNPRPYGVLLAGHGLYTWGDSLFQARRHLEILEFSFELLYRKMTVQPVT